MGKMSIWFSSQISLNVVLLLGRYPWPRWAYIPFVSRQLPKTKLANLFVARQKQGQIGYLPPLPR